MLFGHSRKRDGALNFLEDRSIKAEDHGSSDLCQLFSLLENPCVVIQVILDLLGPSCLSNGFNFTSF